MFTTFDSPLDTLVDTDEILGELTELSDSIDHIKTLYVRDRTALENLRSGLQEFVKENHGVTDASALIEQLCEEFEIDSTRRVSATVSVTYNVYVDAPYTKTLDEVQDDIEGIDYSANIRYGSDYDFIDASVEDVSIEFIEED